ncbi:MAG: putative sporulation protein YtxC [Clostridia bacterium]|nr:putative sporulation protein YtxC [Clostridia bacterium]
MEEYEAVLIDRCIKARYSLCNEKERKRIGEITRAIAKSEDEFFPSYSERLKDVREAVEDYFLKNDTIVPGGFVDFRLKEVYYNVEEMVEKGAERYFAEKELEEFTFLLASFVAEKEPKEDKIHVLWQKSGVRLLNKRGRDVTEKYEKEFYLSALKKGLGEEDLAISALISAAPRELVLHCPPEKSPLKETLVKIFEGRFKVCTGCRICENT